jgi:phosphatidylglycerophosphate synthase
MATMQKERKRGFTDAVRDQSSLLAPLEKRTLVWLAHRMPGWANSDHLTLLGFLSLSAAGLCYAAARQDRRWLLAVIPLLAINWFGDSLDGTLARVRNRQRPRYGFYVDHISDAFGTSILIGGLAASTYMNPYLALTLLVLYLLLSIQTYLATYVFGTFQLSFGKFSPTELRIVLCIGSIALMYRPWVKLFGYGPWRLYDIGGLVAIVFMALMVAAASLKNIARLYREEPLP